MTWLGDQKNLDEIVVEWCKQHRKLVVCIALIVVYFVGFRVYYCTIEGCTHPADWWFHLSAEFQAAWIGAIGTLVAVWWGFSLFWFQFNERRELQRTLAQPAAWDIFEELEIIVSYFGNKVNLTDSRVEQFLRIQLKRESNRLDLIINIPKLETARKTNLFALFRADEVNCLLELIAIIKTYNEAIGRGGTDLAYGGSTPGDIVFLGTKVLDEAQKIRGILRARYKPGKPRILEAAETIDDG